MLLQGIVRLVHGHGFYYFFLSLFPFSFYLIDMTLFYPRLPSFSYFSEYRLGSASFALPISRSWNGRVENERISIGVDWILEESNILLRFF